MQEQGEPAGHPIDLARETNMSHLVDQAQAARELDRLEMALRLTGHRLALIPLVFSSGMKLDARLLLGDSLARNAT